MASRFSTSSSSTSQNHLHQRDPRSSSSLFDGYDRNAAPSRSPAALRRGDPLRSSAGPSPALGAAGSAATQGYGGYGFSAYPSSSTAGIGGGGGNAASMRSSADLSGDGLGGYRKATPNSRGQYSDAVLSSLESQNDEEIEGISARVKMLKNITLAIGDEIRDSTALAEKMNDTFDTTRVKLRGTMNRMLRMAEKTGVGWKVWVCFFLAVIGLFWWVWLF